MEPRQGLAVVSSPCPARPRESRLPSAHQVFNILAFNPGRSLSGRWVEYDEAAAKNAEEKTRAFLHAYLIETSGSGPIKK